MVLSKRFLCGAESSGSYEKVRPSPSRAPKRPRAGASRAQSLRWGTTRMSASAGRRTFRPRPSDTPGYVTAILVRPHPQHDLFQKLGAESNQKDWIGDMARKAAEREGTAREDHEEVQSTT